MPTQPGASQTTSLDPKAAIEKFAGLISETSPHDEPADSASSPAASPPAPTPPAPDPQPADTDSPAPEEPAPEETFEVKVDGEAVLVDLDELKAGYSRHEDYSRKARALADERRAFETEASQVQQERTRYQQGLTQLTEALQQLQGEPDWDTLHRDLPAEEFLKRKADWERSRAHLEKLQRHQVEEAQAAADAHAAQFQKYLRAEQDKLKQAVPEWQDAAKAKAEQDQLVIGAKHYGYTEQEVRQVVDHRALLVLRDALKYRELHREPNIQAKAKVAAIKTAKPGTPDRPRPNERQTKLVEQAAKTHRQRDAMAAIESLLPD